MGRKTKAALRAEFVESFELAAEVAPMIDDAAVVEAIEDAAVLKVPAAKQAPLYALTAKGVALAAKVQQLTLQRSAKGHGAAWRSTGVQKPNSRAICAAALLQKYPDGATLVQLTEFVRANKETLLPAHATVGGRMAMMLSQGYLDVATAEGGAE